MAIDERYWESLLKRIDAGKCTPFLGAGAARGAAPLAADVAVAWAEEYRYPLADAHDLARVAQFVAIEQDRLTPKEELQRWFEPLEPPPFDEPDEPHGTLAELELPVYVTTNYDDFMVQALDRKGRTAEIDMPTWNDYIKFDHQSVLDNGFTPTVDRPLVFHLHGTLGIPESMVLTEDDYLDFLIRMSSPEDDILPAVIKRHFAATSLLFIGYSLSDWTFQVLMRGVKSSIGSATGAASVAVQLPPDDVTDPERAQHYLERYFEKIQLVKVRIYWGTAREFCAELRARHEEFDARA